LIINDSFGALTLALRENNPQNWSDSLLAQQACLTNFKANKLNIDPLQFIQSTQKPQGTFDLVLIKIPKVQALLEEQLIQLKSHIDTETHIISSIMVKYLTKSTLSLLTRILGKTTTSLAKKKARLIFTQYNTFDIVTKSPYPKCYFEPALNLTLCNYSNVFSKNKIDIGTRFLLSQFKQLPRKQKIVDLGCGNGILGLLAQQQQTQAMLYFMDESYMAIASAKKNYQALFNHQNAHFIASNGLEKLVDSVDLILCNPPFHQQHSIGDTIAWQMFQQSHQKLNPKGELWIVGNRHLNYHLKLKKLFGNSQLIASNAQFVVLRAIKNNI